MLTKKMLNAILLFTNIISYIKILKLVMKDVKNFEAMFEAGVEPKDFIEYAFCYRNWYEFARKKRILTPLRIVYHGQENRMICLPFLDLNSKDKVWGIEINNVYYGIRELERVSLAYIDDALQDAEKRLFGDKVSEEYRVHDIDHRYELPLVCELQTLRKFRHEFETTVRILLENGVVADDWFVGDIYWVNRNDFSKIRTYDSRSRRRRVEAPESDSQVCRLMPVMRFTYPIDQECLLSENYRFLGENEPERTMSFL